MTETAPTTIDLDQARRERSERRTTQLVQLKLLLDMIRDLDERLRVIVSGERTNQAIAEARDLSFRRDTLASIAADLAKRARVPLGTGQPVTGRAGQP